MNKEGAGGQERRRRGRRQKKGEMEGREKKGEARHDDSRMFVHETLLSMPVLESAKENGKHERVIEKQHESEYIRTCQRNLRSHLHSWREIKNKKKHSLL